MSEDFPEFALHLRVIFDAMMGCPNYTVRRIEKDLSEIRKRFAHEGIPFVTQRLPLLAKALESALEHGSWISPQGFCNAPGVLLPQMFLPAFKEIFYDNGTLQEEPSAVAISAIRQACYFSYKLDLGHSIDCEEGSLRDFVNLDTELSDQNDWNSSWEQRRIVLTARVLLSNIFLSFNPKDIRPRSGPGASADGTLRQDRYSPHSFYDQIAQYYDYLDMFFVSSDHISDRLTNLCALPVKTEGTSKIRLVPKDSRGPRIICMEPQDYMWLQQGLADKMRARLESHPFTRGHVNFKRQDVNQHLARLGSVHGSLSTLDMKEASDRISRKLVRFLFEGSTSLWPAFDAISTKQYELPNGDVLRSSKFAPMGSSLCFPVMSVLHFVLACACIKQRTAEPLDVIMKGVWVYGDDIIVRSEYTSILFELFPSFSLKFNEGKSFSKGKFRESCGLDVFNGEDVTPIRLKKRLFDDADAASLSAVIDCEANLRKKGIVSAANYLRNLPVFCDLPAVHSAAGLVGWKSSIPSPTRRRWNTNYQCWEYKCRRFKTESTLSMLGCWEQLLRSQLETRERSCDLPSRSSDIKIAWAWVPESTYLALRKPILDKIGNLQM